MQVPGEPLQIDTVSLPGNGMVGMCCCPGRLEFSSVGVRTRDLDRDLGVIIDWEPLTVISLIEQYEFSILGVAHLPERYEIAPFEWYQCPITDLGAPGARFESQFADIEPELLAQLSRGEKILLHCAAGLGRAGTIAARLLIGVGELPVDAIDSVRRARPGAIESKSQEDYLRSLTSGKFPS